ncbi:MAG: class I SAM-dependent RNA methyltransferase [Anaerolineales bacterium]
MKTSQTFEIEIIGMGFGGAAFGRLNDGRMAFVPYAISGERVCIAIKEEKPHYVHAELVEIIKPAASRIIPRCPHFGVCGGCHYQHIRYEDQLQIKSAILEDQLKRIGGFKRLPEIEIIPAPSSWNYRNTLQFHLTDQGKLGYHKAESTEILGIEECYLGQSPLQGLWKQIEFEPGLGIERLHLRCGINDDVMLILECQNAEIPISVVHLNAQEAVVLAGSDHLWIGVHERLFHLSAGAFFQVNNTVAEKMVDHLLTHLEWVADMTVFDVYCGGGLYSAFIAEKVGRIIGIESASAACQDFEINLAEFDNVELYEAPAESVLPYLNITADVMLLDPPRSGLTKSVRQAIATRPPGQLIYISCDPSTFSRDARHLAKTGFELEKLVFFDMFPQTYHLESVSYWRYR